MILKKGKGGGGGLLDGRVPAKTCGRNVQKRKSPPGSPNRTDSGTITEALKTTDSKLWGAVYFQGAEVSPDGLPMNYEGGGNGPSGLGDLVITSIPPLTAGPDVTQ